MAALGAICIGDDVDFATAAHRDGDVVEREPGQVNAQDDLGRIRPVDLQRSLGWLGALVENCEGGAESV